jgi:hypothetical protein
MGSEGFAPILFGLVGPSFGGSFVALFNTQGECNIYSGLEGGIGTGLDWTQSNLPSFVWTTSTLQDFSGTSLNFSGDAGPLSAGFQG